MRLEYLLQTGRRATTACATRAYHVASASANYVSSYVTLSHKPTLAVGTVAGAAYALMATSQPREIISLASTYAAGIVGSYFGKVVGRESSSMSSGGFSGAFVAGVGSAAFEIMPKLMTSGELESQQFLPIFISAAIGGFLGGIMSSESYVSNNGFRRSRRKRNKVQSEASNFTPISNSAVRQFVNASVASSLITGLALTAYKFFH